MKGQNFKIRKRLSVKHFSLRHTFESAQPLTFFADYDGSLDKITYPNFQRIISIKALGSIEKGSLVIGSAGIGSKDPTEEVRSRMRLDDNMENIYSNISTDKFIEQGIERYDGMRLTINDPWETTVCFITSQYNNIKRIRLIIRKIMEEYGDPIFDSKGNQIGKSFPSSDKLVRVSEKEFLLCGAGFRAKYLKNAAEYCTNNLDLNRLKRRDYSSIKEELMGIKGIGDKVADCIALMGYGRLDAFPIDVWIKRTLEKLYFDSEKKSIDKLHDFANERWGAYAGYAQQYLFHSARNKNI